MIGMKRRVKCPYCGVEQLKQIEPHAWPKRDIVVCDPENAEAGCDKEFVIKWEVTVDVYAFGIEGVR